MRFPFAGSYCNHYFLQMLAHIGRGYYDASYDVGQFHQVLILCDTIIPIIRRPYIIYIVTLVSVIEKD